VVKVRRVGRPTESDSEETRRQLLRAASVRFAHDGYARTTLRSIAQEAGLTAGTLYHHFATKSELYLAVYQSAVDEITAANMAALEGAVDFASELRAMLNTGIDMLNRSIVAPLIVARAWVDPALDGTPSVPVESSSQVLIDEWLDRAVSRGDIPADEITLWRPLVRAMLWGVGMLHLTEAYPMDLVVDGLVDKMLASTAALQSSVGG
jgi:AcrR family transcriptional regulator